MNIYLASRYSRREELCGYRAQAEQAGHTVTGRWLNGPHQIAPCGQTNIGEHGAAEVEAEGDDATASDLKAFFAADDVKDVQSADVVISFTEPPRGEFSRGGRHVEFGVGLALGKRLIVVGYRENVFHYLPVVEFAAMWADALLLLHTSNEPAFEGPTSAEPLDLEAIENRSRNGDRIVIVRDLRLVIAALRSETARREAAEAERDAMQRRAEAAEADWQATEARLDALTEAVITTWPGGGFTCRRCYADEGRGQGETRETVKHAESCPVGKALGCSS